MCPYFAISVLLFCAHAFLFYTNGIMYKTHSVSYFFSLRAVLLRFTIYYVFNIQNLLYVHIISMF